MNSSLQVIPREMRVDGKSVVVESDTTLVPVRTLVAIAASIRHEHQLAEAAGRKALEHAVRCGEELREAKARVPKGQWRAWIAENCLLSDASVQNYMRMAAYVDYLRETEIDSISGALRFLKENQLQLPGTSVLTPEQRGVAVELRATGASLTKIAEILGVGKSTIKRYLDDPLIGSRLRPGGPGGKKVRGGRKRGRSSGRAIQSRAITDDLVEGAAIKLREIFGPGGKPTDSDRDTAVEILRAAFRYDGPIPGEKDG